MSLWHTKQLQRIGTRRNYILTAHMGRMLSEPQHRRAQREAVLEISVMQKNPLLHLRSELETLLGSEGHCCHLVSLSPGGGEVGPCRLEKLCSLKLDKWEMTWAQTLRKDKVFPGKGQLCTDIWTASCPAPSKRNQLVCLKVTERDIRKEKRKSLKGFLLRGDGI